MAGNDPAAYIPVYIVILLCILFQYRLQPLGVVNDSVFLPTDCLGVVPGESSTLYWHCAFPHIKQMLRCVFYVLSVSPKDKSPSRKQRPRSSTAPSIHFDLPDSNSQAHNYERVGKKVNLKRRSYSAVLTRHLRTGQLLHLLSISKHTGLVPSSNGLMENTSDVNEMVPQESPFPSPRNENSSSAGILPPVVQHGELGMTIKVRRLRKDVSDKPADSSTPQKSTSQPESHVNTSKKSLSDSSSNKLPQIQSSPEALKENSVTQPKSSQPAEESPIKNITPFTSPIKVSIVSIGETNKVESRSKVAKPKRHTSGKQNSGRLSLGWSPPQPIEALKGSPLNTPTKKVTVDSPTLTTDDGRPSTPGLTINVDVNEFLLDLDET